MGRVRTAEVDRGVGSNLAFSRELSRTHGDVKQHTHNRFILVIDVSPPMNNLLGVFISRGMF